MFAIVNAIGVLPASIGRIIDKYWKSDHELNRHFFGGKVEVLTLWGASFRDHRKCIAKLVLIGLIVWGYSISPPLLYTKNKASNFWAFSYPSFEKPCISSLNNFTRQIFKTD